MDTIVELLDRQAGVVSRRQLREVERGEEEKQRDAQVDLLIARRLRRREWVMVHQGVYVNHTGELTHLQRSWAAVLYAWPAALCHASALRAAEGPGCREQDDGIVHVAVSRSRRVRPRAGVRIHRVAELETRVQWNRSPPRLRYEEAVLDVVAAVTDDLASIAVLARAVQSRRTTARRMATALSSRPRFPRRAWLTDVLTDVANGTCSVLEHGYLTHVERAHGLPVADRQKADRGRSGRIYRDASYAEPLEVELDGRLEHSSVDQRESDYDRDLTTLVDGRITARLSWGQVFARSCWTAAQIDTLLREGGWEGKAEPCRPDCEVGASPTVETPVSLVHRNFHTWPRTTKAPGR